MTLKELSQLYWLNREIEMDKKRLEELESELSSVSSPEISDMPKSTSYDNKLERKVIDKVCLQSIIDKKNKRCIQERIKLELYICTIPDSLLRQIFTYRFINGLTWYQIAEHIGGGNTEDSVRMTCYRYLKKINSK